MMNLEDPVKAQQCMGPVSDEHVETGLHVLPTLAGNGEVVIDVNPISRRDGYRLVTLHMQPGEAVRLALQLVRQAVRSGWRASVDDAEQICVAAVRAMRGEL